MVHSCICFQHSGWVSCCFHQGSLRKLWQAPLVEFLLKVMISASCRLLRMNSFVPSCWGDFSVSECQEAWPFQPPTSLVLPILFLAALPGAAPLKVQLLCWPSFSAYLQLAGASSLTSPLPTFPTTCVLTPKLSISLYGCLLPQAFPGVSTHYP